MKKIILFFFFFPVISFAQPKKRSVLDSLLGQLSSETYPGRKDVDKADLLNEVADRYIRRDRDSAVFYANKALLLAKKASYKHGRGRALEIMGTADYSDYDEALTYLFGALKIFEDIHDDHSVARVLDKIGGVYFNLDKYPQALDYFSRVLAIYQRRGDKSNIAATLHHIAATYGNMGNNSKSRDYELSALKLFEETGQAASAGIAYGNIALTYASEKRYNEALSYGFKALEMQNKLSENGIKPVIPLSMIASIYLLIATDSTSVIREDSLLPRSRKANLEKAVQYYSEAYDAGRKTGDMPPVDMFKEWAEALSLQGRYVEAFTRYKDYVHQKDSLLSKDALLNVSAQETKRESDLKEKQIELNKIQKASVRTERWLFVVSVALCIVIMLSVLRNYREQKKLNNTLAIANKRLAEEKEKSDDLTAELSKAADMKTRFLANISHELRTPVTLLTGMLELMKQNEDRNEVMKGGKITAGGNRGNEERLEVAYNNSRKLQFMVEEILDLSRIESKYASLSMENREAAPLFKRMVYAFETFIEKEQISLAFNEYDVRGLHISVDEHMLEKIVNNLVYNAVKFNERNGCIKVSLLPSTDRTQFIFTINNSGNLIKPDDLPHIFERFYQGQTTAARAEGVGIGLSLVREFTSLMKGTVEVNSIEGAGTTFTLSFPVATASPGVKDETDVEIELPVEVWDHFPERQTVLLVEDNDEMRFYLREVLSGKVNLAEAVNGKKAVEWLAGNKADLIITDMMMPEMGGEEFVGILKSNVAYKKIPVITLTALADSGSRLNMLRLGIDDYIVKPFNSTELRVRVYNLLNNLEERRQFEGKPTEQDDIPLESKEAETFREQVVVFVQARMKKMEVSVYDLAYELNMSERQLYRLSKKMTGCTPAQLIKEVRLQRAYELLMSGTIYKVEDVARQVGFEDSNYFSRQFHERFGKRPTELL